MRSMVLILGLCIMGWPMSKGERTPEPSLASPTEAEMFIETKKIDSRIYWGEGISNIENDLGKAKIEAKKRAQADLTEKIEVTIESDITTILSATDKKVMRDQITEKINAYTQQVLNDVNERYFIDHPRKKELTYFIFISRHDYVKRVNEDLENKKSILRQTVQGGDRELSASHCMAALRNWLLAYQASLSFFGGLPLQDDLNSDGKKEEVTFAIIQRISRLFDCMTIILLNENEIKYGPEGELVDKPDLLIQYQDSAGNKTGVGNLPIKISFETGRGNCPGNLLTGAYGQIELPVSQLDASFTLSYLNVSVDMERIEGISSIASIQPPNFLIPMKKIRTVVIFITATSRPAEISFLRLENEIKEVLLSKGLAAVSGKNIVWPPEHRHWEELRKNNADYLLAIALTFSGSNNVGNFQNLHVASCAATFNLHTVLPQRLIGARSIPAAKGFGVDGSAAAGDALQRNKKELIAKINELLVSLP